MVRSLDWAGGLITGEGCFTLSVRKNRKREGSDNWLHISPVFSVTMTDIDTMDSLISTFRANDLPVYVTDGVSRSRSGQERPTRTIVLNGQSRVMKVATALLPHLDGQKLEAATAVLEFCQHRQARRTRGVDETDIDCFNRARAANARNGERRWGHSDLRDYMVEAGRCAQCGAHRDEQSPKCNACSARHSYRRKVQRRYSPNSERKPESAAEMTAPV